MPVPNPRELGTAMMIIMRGQNGGQGYIGWMSGRLAKTGQHSKLTNILTFFH